MRRLFLLSVLIVNTLFVLADDSGTCGPNLTWNYTADTKTLTIEGTGEMQNYGSTKLAAAPWINYSIENIIITQGVTSIGSWAFIKKGSFIEIPNSVTSIGESAFYNCTGLTSITIPNSVTSIGNDAFSYCKGLTSINIPNSVKSIGNNAFYNCLGLTSVTIGNGVTSIRYATFYGCSSLTSVIIPNNVTSIGERAFSGCSSLTSVTIPNSVTSIGKGAFGACSGLTSVTIPNSVTSIGEEAFSYCSGLTSVTIPNSVTSIGEEAFSYCSGLTSVTIPNSVTSIGDNAFKNCPDLTSITIDSNTILSKTYSANDNLKYIFGGNVKTYTIGNSVKSIGESAFDGCSKLTSITIPKSVTNIGTGAFKDCSGLKKIIVPDIAAWCGIIFADKYSNPLYYAQHLYSEENTEIIELVIPESVTSIEDYAFSSCSDLTSVTIPNSVTSIGEEAFSYCKGLTSITIPNSVKSIGESAFHGCSGLTSVTIPNSVTSIGSYAFYNCSGLTSVTIPNSVTSIGSYAFYNCSGLTSVTIDSGVTSIGSYAFYDCAGLTSITIPNSVTSIGDWAFSGCSGLTSVTIPSSVTSIGSSAFKYCSNLTEVVLNSNSVASETYSYTSSLKDIFGTNVKSYILGDKVTSIGNYAFEGCSGLMSISIPESVTSIGSLAFYGCKNLASVTLPNNIKSIGNGQFSNTNLYVETGTKTLLTLWNGKYTNIYDVKTKTKIPTPSLSLVKSTQTTMEVKIDKMYEGYKYKYEDKFLTDNSIYIDGLYPAYSKNFRITISLDDISYIISSDFTTKSINPMVKGSASCASSLLASGSYTQGDAVVVKEILTCNGKEVEGKNISVSGLNPNTSYSVQYTITVASGYGKYTYTGTASIKTKALTLTTEQPKVVSVGNVIVSATTNVDPSETNVGVEWRRTDWSSDFASQTAPAILMDGTMEGYIRNLNADKLWKYRAYYLSNSGTYYYGDWVGIDPSNTSYFEPTVYTYSNIDVKGNSALLKGYTLGGTNKVVVQGFKYWKMANGNGNRSSAVSVPADAMTETVAIVGSGQQLMNATLKNLDYNTTYYYVAFATTENYETFYGEERVFNVDANPTRIEGVKEEVNSNEAATVVAYYDINGVRLSRPQKGINIVRMSDGTSRKIVVR